MRAGTSFPIYRIALARYRVALAGSMAGNVAPEQIIAAVFGDRSSSRQLYPPIASVSVGCR
jgi:hypothetical protein